MLENSLSLSSMVPRQTLCKWRLLIKDFFQKREKKLVESGGGGFVKGIRLGVMRTAHVCMRITSSRPTRDTQLGPVSKPKRKQCRKKKSSSMKPPSIGIKLHFCKPLPSKRPLGDHSLCCVVFVFEFYLYGWRTSLGLFCASPGRVGFAYGK